MNKLLLRLSFLMVLAVPAARAEEPLKVCMLSGSEEYESDRTLSDFQKYLEAHYPVRCTLLKAEGTDHLPGLKALEDCDVALFFTRRLTISGEELEAVKRYVLAGKPIVGVRTASHGFQNWLEFDKLVQGGNYHGHFSNKLTMRASVAPGAKEHPVVQGVGVIASRGSLYKTEPLADDCVLLMTGKSPEGTQPVAWTREFRGGRVFYTSLGAQGDFENATYRRLLTNALFWAAKREVPASERAEQPALRERPKGTIRLALRSRSGRFDEVSVEKEVPAAEVAVIVCDMWDKHWCSGANRRCDAIAQKMNPVLTALRDRGVQIVHAPSECMGFYAGTTQRLRAQMAPSAPKAEEVDLPAEPPLPIDDSSGGCDTDDAMYLAWTRQTPRLDVGPFDAVSDNGDEVYNLLRQLGVKYVLMMGVHTNMCVLNRAFAIRSMTRKGMKCVLVRDLTDTMYDPRDRPFVSHDEGTDLVVKHIEAYLAPSTTSDSLLSGLRINGEEASEVRR